MFITFEGPEGSGKSSHIPLLAQYLKDHGYNVLTTREPGGTPISDQVRTILMDMRNQGMHPRAEILLFCAARAQLVEQVIRPALETNTIVLCDRYADSTLAYQGYGHGLDLTVLRSLLHFATGGLFPNLTLLLDVEPRTGLQRRKNGGEWNRMDAFTLAFHERVRAGYLNLAAEEPSRFRVIDAAQPMDKVQADIRSTVLSAIKA